MSKERTIEKIKKLLNIAKHDTSSDGDIEAAMLQAQRLMDKHHLSEEDLVHETADDYQKVDEAELGRFRSWVGGRVFFWECQLAAFVSRFVGVPYYLDDHKKPARDNGILKRNEFGEAWKGKSFVFYGVAEDASIAKHLYDELRKLISTMAYARYGQIYVKDGAVYCQGFIQGLNDQMELQRKEQKAIATNQGPGSTGLILIERRADLIAYKEDKAKNWLKNTIGIKLVAGGGLYGGMGSSEAYNQGKADGREADIDATRRKKIGV